MKIEKIKLEVENKFSILVSVGGSRTLSIYLWEIEYFTYLLIFAEKIFSGLRENSGRSRNFDSGICRRES
ncbi:hypothetical protein, partial [Dapis sp. BLCC M172]|uniref:hypothetical protein n=1 Tax=Dapis sp. BLCC M172 TaxID=2975281 RepID=UPI003CF96700